MRRLALLLIPIALTTVTRAQQVDPLPVMIRSSASSDIGVTPDSLASVYGSNLATVVVAASQLPWPTALGDMPGVFIIDSAGKRQDCSLIYVSQTQMNLWIPPRTATGNATLNFPFTGLPIGVGTAALRTTPITIAKVAPSLFTTNGTGAGTAAATAVRFTIDFSHQTPVPVFDCLGSNCFVVPIELGIDTPVYLSLFGTGIRGGSDLSHVAVTIGGQKITVSYAGPQGTIPGLDQVNVGIPLSLRGAGVVDVTVTVDGITSNPVQIGIH